ncbi:MAG: bestrophin family ion channel [Oculatellaceae cyanobacterium bins.114]|nr:bestrophin family ion channel [Oculatellaceae cyanobacterium bins.114]
MGLNRLSDRRHWFRYALQLRGSVIPAILPRTFVCGGFGTLISIFYYAGIPVSMPILASLIPNIVLGLMLVFRTNTAYERFWEGRRLWGNLNNAIRNLARQVWVVILEEKPQDRQEKAATLRLLVAFAVAMKLHLRQEPIGDELKSLLSSSRFFTLKEMLNPPLEIAFWIGDYLQQQYRGDRLNIYQLNAMQELLNQMVDALGGCERILKTPIPLAYAIHLKQLLLIYCLSLPFQFVKDLNMWTGLIVALVSFTLFGIEEIGIEIENPFGRDPNDLPLDTICATMLHNIEDLMTLTPSNTNPFGEVEEIEMH